MAEQRIAFEWWRRVFWAGLCLVAFSGDIWAQASKQPQSLEAVSERLQSEAVPASEILESVRAAQNGSGKDDIQLGMMFREACLRADSRMLPALIEVFEKLPADSFGQNESFPALASLWLQNEVPRTLKKKPEFSESGMSLPSVPAGYPEELVEAMKRYVRVAEPYRKIAESRNLSDEGRYFQAEEKEYWEQLCGMMRQKEGQAAGKVLAFYWGGGCGTGSEIFMVPHASAVVVGLVHDRRWAEAAGASMSVIGGKEIDGALHVLQACVPDPLKVITGGLAFADLSPQSFWREAGRMPMLVMLLRMPGDDRVDQLIEVTKQAPPEAKEQYFRALAKLAPASEAKASENPMSSMMIFEGGASLEELEPRPVSAAAAGRAEEFLRAQVPDNLSIAAGEALISILREKKWPGSAATLHRMLDHPSATVAKRAAEVLKEQGTTVEIPPKLGPVRYRITVDGIPYASKQVQWAVSMGDTSMSSEVTTDADGIASLSRDRFIDKTSQKVQQVILRSMYMKGPGDPWFSAALKPPPETDEVIPVEVGTKAIKVNIPAFRPAEELKGVHMDVLLRGVDVPGQQAVGYWPGAQLTLPFANEVTFAKVMPGPYEVVIRAPGATVWSGRLVGGQEPEITASVQRASDVKFTLKVPDEKSFRPTPELRKDGKPFAADWDYKNSRYRGIPEGKYVIHVPSIAEIRAQYPKFPLEGPEFEGADVSFEVGPESPVEIDLGEIDLTAKAG